MKKLILLSAMLMCLVIKAKANHLSSDLNLQLFNHANMLVEFDHVRYTNPFNTFCINDVEPGIHYLTVFKIRTHGYGYNHYAPPALIFNGCINVPASVVISAVINPYHEYDVVQVFPKRIRENSFNYNSSYFPTAPGYGMNPGSFQALKRSIEVKSFDNTRLTIAKQAIQSNPLTSRQIADLVQLMTFESTKLSLAKFAYDYALDKENYYALNDVFTFESSIEELNKFISHRS